MERTLIKDLAGKLGSDVYIAGFVEGVREFKGFRFLFLRDRTNTTQIVLPNEVYSEKIGYEYSIGILGAINAQTRSKYHGLEVLAKEINVLSMGEEGSCFSPQDKNLTIESMLDRRVASLKLEENRAIFEMQSKIFNLLSAHLHTNGFTEVKTPKIIASGLEGGSNLFNLDYFGKLAHLSQSPQLYHQMLMASFERVFEIGACFRAENYATTRHVNEFTSLDGEMGFIRDHHDVMDFLESTFLKLQLPGIPVGKPFPVISYDEAIKISNKGIGGRLSGEDKRAIGEYALKKFETDFLFIQGFPNEISNFYIMPGKDGRTKSFKLLYKGQEICTGGQRIHDYKQLRETMELKGIDPHNFAEYLGAFRCGIPPHGGFSIGLNRLTSLVANVPNVKLAVLFPRDPKRLLP